MSFSQSHLSLLLSTRRYLHTHNYWHFHQRTHDLFINNGTSLNTPTTIQCRMIPLRFLGNLKHTNHLNSSMHANVSYDLGKSFAPIDRFCRYSLVTATARRWACISQGPESMAWGSHGSNDRLERTGNIIDIISNRSAKSRVHAKSWIEIEK